MLKTLFGLLGWAAVPLAYALTDAETPVDQVSPLTVLVFLVAVVAGIVGFLWWSAHRGGGGDDQGKAP